MSDIQYIGELLWPGQIAHFLIILSFFSAGLAVLGYFKSTKEQIAGIDASWKKIGRAGFSIHGIATLSLIAILFWLMIEKRFEYAYVFEHVSDDLDMRYIFSAFWEGQEGSFLLWMFWHVILGFIILFKGGKWESPVLCSLALIELFLASMLLGLHIEIGDFLYKIGSNPTLLLRDTFDAPIFSKADYLASIKGTGLNPLLQNYWMTIHPPTLFLGFASTAMPFCFAIAGLWTGDHKSILKPILKWSLFSGFILGTGILMGGAWAYEALTFGGYWAWDPVENMSLVPWLILVGGIHCNLIARATGYSIKSTYLFYILTFVMILYSTFMTRSGVLGESSVHSFTDMGLEWQLVALVSFFLLFGLSMYFGKAKSIPVIKKEEHITSREFWMYIGALVMLFSGVIIAYSTSLPVYNRIMTFFDPAFEGRVITDPIPHFNKYQIWIGVFVCILSAKTLYTNYKKTSISKTLKTTTPILLGASLLAGILTYFSIERFNLHSWQYIVLAFCGYFSVLANLYYLLVKTKGNLKLASSAISHIGFAAMIIGILSSGLSEKVITKNPFAMKGLMEDENITTSINLIKGEPMFAENYWMTYVRDSIVGNMRIFQIDFKEVDKAGSTKESFTLFPNILYTNDFSKVATANPSTKHFMTKDIFTNISSLPRSQMDTKFAKEMEDTIRYETYDASLSDTLFTKQNFVIVNQVSLVPTNKNFLKEENDFGIEVQLEIGNLENKETRKLTPALGVKENMIFTYPGKADEYNFQVKLDETILNNYFTPENALTYQTFVVKEGESFKFEDYNIRLRGFDRAPELDTYKQLEQDIAVATILDVERKEDRFTMSPVFVVRDMRPMNVKDYNLERGIHARFLKVDPATKEYTIQFARDIRSNNNIPLRISENVPRTDFITLQAKEVPGINLFWLGSIMMMLGLLLGFLNRLRAK